MPREGPNGGVAAQGKSSDTSFKFQLARPGHICLEEILPFKWPVKRRLDYADATFHPDVCVHALGVTLKAADMLSRTYDPALSLSVPVVLGHCEEVTAPERNCSFWRLPAPSVPAPQRGSGGNFQ